MNHAKLFHPYKTLIVLLVGALAAAACTATQDLGTSATKPDAGAVVATDGDIARILIDPSLLTNYPNDAAFCQVFDQSLVRCADASARLTCREVGYGCKTRSYRSEHAAPFSTASCRTVVTPTSAKSPIFWCRQRTTLRLHSNAARSCQTIWLAASIPSPPYNQTLREPWAPVLTSAASSRSLIAKIQPENCSATETKPQDPFGSLGLFVALYNKCEIHLSVFEGLCAADDFHQLVGNAGLTGAVVDQAEFADHVLCVACGGVHGAHAGAVLRGLAVEERA